MWRLFPWSMFHDPETQPENQPSILIIGRSRAPDRIEPPSISLGSQSSDSGHSCESPFNFIVLVYLENQFLHFSHMVTYCISICLLAYYNRAIIKKNKVEFKVMSNERIEALDWSPWLDFNRDNIANIAESEGVYKIHADMKILFIGSSQNLRESMIGCLSDPCISKAKRFSYALIESAEKVKEELIEEYRIKHKGKLPTCME